MQRLRELDSLRGLAALGVLAHHVLCCGALPVAFVNHLRSTPLQPVVTGRPFVLFFFVLSGFVLSRSLSRTAHSRSYLAWMLERTLRLMIPALLSVFLSAFLYRVFFSGIWGPDSEWLATRTWLQEPTWDRIAQQGMLLSSSDLNTALWSLAVEWRMSLAIPAMVWLASRRTRDGLLTLALLALACTAFAGDTPTWRLGFDDSPIESAKAFLYFGLPFALGVILERIRVHEFSPIKTTSWTAAIAVVALARVGSDDATFVASAILIWIAQQPGFIRTALRCGPLTWLGRISFSLYLVHLPLLQTLFHLSSGHLSVVQTALLTVVVALPAAWLFHIVIERPTQSVARLLTTRLPATRPVLQPAKVTA